MKEKRDLMSDMKRIADITYASGLYGLDPHVAIYAIRMLTNEHCRVDVERTEEQIKDDARDAINEAVSISYAAAMRERSK